MGFEHSMHDMPIDLAKSLALDPKPIISLSEGTDPRIVAGAVAAQEQGIADIILIGAHDQIAPLLATHGVVAGNGIEIHDPNTSSLTETFALAYFEARKHKGMTFERATQDVQHPLNYAAMLVRQGHATGTVNGAVETTSDVVRSALRIIGKSAEAALVSSCFLIYPPNARAMVYSDCGLVIDPNNEELADIAIMAAKSCRDLLRETPRIAMLSFSTKGSASHANATKVIEATKRVREIAPDLAVDGELQFDAAFVPAIGERKAPASAVAGHANVMVFPNLDAGNIAYKISERIGGASAIGPILQGLSKPANDLSRGCSASDVTEMIAVTVLQAAGARHE